MSEDEAAAGPLAVALEVDNTPGLKSPRWDFEISNRELYQVGNYC